MIAKHKINSKNMKNKEGEYAERAGDQLRLLYMVRIYCDDNDKEAMIPFAVSHVFIKVSPTVRSELR